MERHTALQLLGLALFVVLGMVGVVLGGSLTGGYLLGLLCGFAIGISVAIFQYGVVVEIQSDAGGYTTAIATKIDDAFE